jgi:ATP-dependent Clp protease ATP-binding subunit ClpB
LTDGQGRTVNFANTIIIMTSNLGAEYINNNDAKNDFDKMKKLVLEQVKQFFRPEFVNRLDEIVFFNRLAIENMNGIVQIQLKNLQKRLLAKNIDIEFDPTVVQYLSIEGFDPIFGARPLKRVIQDKIQNQLANFILSGKVKEKSKIRVVFDQDTKAITDQSKEKYQEDDDEDSSNLPKIHGRIKFLLRE